jgi:prepilin peptidase CpaA
MSMQVWIAMLVGVAAMIDDLSRRHIANWIPAAALAGGFGWQIGTHGWPGALTALGGAVAGFAVFLIFYLLGGMGGGDVKLMAGFGALLGPGQLLSAAIWTGAVGGILAAGAIAWKAWRPASPAVPGSGVVKGAREAELSPEERDEERDREASIPYAPAIALGVWLSLAARG